MGLHPSLAHYKITGKLGEGGMGAVYRATDTKLNREVAIKVIPGAFASDPDRVARFTREAHILASLNHPNIAQIYGVEENAIVMELVEGTTLAERLAAGSIPVEESLALARQIADALEAAHEKGIIHRDLKPANVKITPEGKVKVLDFGLAKALAGVPANSNLSESPTLTTARTTPGAVLGTPTYMSPEQARGKPSDKRTDVWSFGCVLYEMLTGRQAFAAETVSDTIAKILGGEPDWEQLPAKTPPAIPILLRRCLQKDPGRRLRDLGDARIEIEESLAGPANVGSAAPASLGTRPAELKSFFLPSIAVIVLAIVGVAAWNLWRPGRPAPRPLNRVALTLPTGEPLWVRVGTSVAISPDGSRVVYVASRSGSTQLYLRAMDQFEAAPIPGTEGAEGPFFSPDGERVGFFADHKLKKVALHGGAPSIVCGAPVTLGASWGPDDTIVFSAAPDGGLLRVAAAGGVPEILTTSDAKNGESGHYWPEILPGGKAVLYTVVTSSGDAHITLRRLDSGESRILIQGGITPHYASTGHLVFARGGALLAAPFDVERLRVTGPEVLVLDGVLSTVFAGAQFVFSQEGSLVYLPGGVQALERTLVWVDRKGTVSPLSAPTRPYMDPRLSRNGQQILSEVYEKTKGDVWVYELARGTLTRLTFDGFENETPLWTPQGSRIVFTSSRGGTPMAIFSKPADRTGDEEQLLMSQHHQHLGSISPDGRWLALTDYDPINGGDIWVMPLEGDHKPRPFLQTPFHEWGPVFSPDGRWLAYVSNESGRDEIYVQAFPGPGLKLQISSEGGIEPVWPRTASELFYRNGDKMMAVTVATAPDLNAGKPRLLFEGRFVLGLTLGHTNYDISADGQRFLMIQEAVQQAAPKQVNVVLNWFDELKRRVPAGTK